VTERLVYLSHGDTAIILRAATTRYPLECCGLIEGTATSEGWRIFAVHETRNLAGEAQRRFLIDPQQQIELLRALRGTTRDVIGCFHSHPNGPSEPSAIDLSQAAESDFIWVIASGTPPNFALNAFLFTGESFEPLRLVQTG
jgi:proteasome lid subunit RPN8/RPN11